MKKQGILNVELAAMIAGLGHMDTFLVADAGMPIPDGVFIVDLVLCGGIPSFRQVLDAILTETVVEHYTIAVEIEEHSPELLDYIKETLSDVEGSMVTHLELKQMSKNVKFAVRTGEFSKYPNVILRAGVAF